MTIARPSGGPSTPPRERVWRAFTDLDDLVQWFVPEGMEAEVRALDPVPGGEMSVSWTAEGN